MRTAAALQACTSPHLTDPAPSPCQQDVPNGLYHVPALSDEVLELAIWCAGQQMEAAMARYAVSGNLADRGDADRHRLRMEALIRGRSAAQVERMERERGLA